ncbi:tetratricopeptide repeat protein 1-like [Impatiens glandulifera]|uniref:tetratricopeptide repeat protein 1-like n=1 Tax=Impatiens glandulifera TaxID=253017 RepID=UPI001FB085B7|nr:tetratricopeptide repeat protein 1-like [Impatiens glandulifera]
MVLIEPEPMIQGEDNGNIASKMKVKPSASSSLKVEESSGAETAAGNVSDGFETASEKDLSDEDDEVTEEKKQQNQQESETSLPSTNDSIEAASDENKTSESKEKALAEANNAKLEGNTLFKSALYEDALLQYDLALQIAPDMPSSLDMRSNCHANRALCFSKLMKNEDTVKECTKALELNPSYIKALLRRAEAHEKLEHFEEAIADMKKILELDQSDSLDKTQASRNIKRLEPLAAEKRERMKEEMMGKLKEMGNTVLGRFGMSVDNFKAIKDPNTGSYSISFQR